MFLRDQDDIILELLLYFFFYQDLENSPFSCQPVATPSLATADVMASNLHKIIFTQTHTNRQKHVHPIHSHIHLSRYLSLSLSHTCTHTHTYHTRSCRITVSHPCDSELVLGFILTPTSFWCVLGRKSSCFPGTLSYVTSLHPSLIPSLFPCAFRQE